MTTRLIDLWEESEIDHKCSIIIRSNKCMFTEGHWKILTIELGIEFLIEINTMSSDFKSINSSCFINIMESIIIKEFTRGWIKMNTVLSILMSKETKSMPISCLPNTRVILIRKNTKINIFSREFKLIHKDTWIALVNSDLLISVYSNKCKTDLLNINIMNCWMSENIISIQIN